MHVPLSPPAVDELFVELTPARMARVLGTPLVDVPGDDGYLHWDKLCHLEPPGDLSHREWWLGLKVLRGGQARTVPLLDTTGRLFTFTLPDVVLELLHRVDQQASGRIDAAETVTNPATRDRYVMTSLIEEAGHVVPTRGGVDESQGGEGHAPHRARSSHP